MAKVTLALPALEERLPPPSHSLPDILARALLRWLQGDHSGATSLLRSAIRTLPPAERDKALDQLARWQELSGDSHIAAGTRVQAAALAAMDNRADQAVTYLMQAGPQAPLDQLPLNLATLLRAAATQHRKIADSQKDEADFLAFGELGHTTIADQIRLWQNLPNDAARHRAAAIIGDAILASNYGTPYDPDRAVALFQLADGWFPQHKARTLLEAAASASHHGAQPNFRLFRQLIDRWWQEFAKHEVASVNPIPLSRPQPGPLRIGLLDLTGMLGMNHYYYTQLAPTFRALRGDRFKLYLYSLAPLPPTAPAVTENEHWTLLAGDQSEAAQQIANDRLDVLLIPSGFVAGAPLRLLAAHPARRLALWGHTHITYGPELLDAVIIDPVSYNDFHASITCETPIVTHRHPALLGISAEAPPVSPAPRHQQGWVTFGIFNRLSKFTDTIIGLWAQILSALPEARLAFANVYFNDPGRSDALRNRLAQHGLPLDRVILLPYESETFKHLSHYAQIDISLDTFPFNGGITTMESLWQGVPVISRADETPIGRSGLNLLSSLGLNDLVAFSDEQYVNIATTLAQNSKRLDELRDNLRNIMHTSPLMNPEGFPDMFEDAIKRVLSAPARRINNFLN